MSLKLLLIMNVNFKISCIIHLPKFSIVSEPLTTESLRPLQTSNYRKEKR